MSRGGFHSEESTVLSKELSRHCSDYLEIRYGSVPVFVSNVEKDWLAKMQNALNIFLDGTFGTHQAVLKFFHATSSYRGLGMELFLKKGDIILFSKAVWMLCLIAMLNDLGMNIYGKNMKRSGSGGHFYLQMVYSVGKNKEVLPDGCNVFHSMEDLQISFTAMQSAAGQQYNHLGTKVKKPYKYMMYTNIG